MLLGRAAIERNPDEARRFLMRAKHLYDQVAADLGSSTCELYLTQVEQRLGFAARSRLHVLSHKPLHQWRTFANELRIVRAECIAQSNPDLAQRLLLEARNFAIQSGNRSLVEAVDNTVRNNGLVPFDALPPLEAEITPPRDNQTAYVPPGGPQRIEEESASVVALVANIENRRRSAQRLVGGNIRCAPAVGLTPPRASGVGCR